MDLFKKLTGLKTLLIDDNEIVRDTLTMVFSYKKCFIKAVASAEEGLRALEAEGFDIIICDFSLPGINGVEFFRQIMAAYPDAVKVLISGYAVENTVAQALESGVDAFLKKPFSLFALLEQLAPLTEKYQLAEHSRHHLPKKKTAFKIKNALTPQEITGEI